MCGILSVLRYDSTLCKSIQNIKKKFIQNNMRGPEQSDFIYDKEDNYILGFHRLAIKFHTFHSILKYKDIYSFIFKKL